MAYTTIDNPELYFQTKLYTGNGGTQSITLDGSENMQPDWVWIKDRSATNHNMVTDSVRGATKTLFTNLTNAESTDVNTVTAFNSDGFSIGSDTNNNANTNTYVSWNWKAGTSVSGNTTGSGTSKTYTGSVNTTSGFSITKFVGNGTAGHTIPHNLGAVPKIIILKDLQDITHWNVYTETTGNTRSLLLTDSGIGGTSSGYWNNTTPTSSVFTLGSDADLNGNDGNFIAYCFAEIPGYSKFGSYTGNASTDGTFVYTGFKPAWIMFKPDSSADWTIVDAKRNTFNVVKDKTLNANLNSAEHDGSADLDFLSNGFKIRNANTDTNHSGTIIYMTFAESPFVTSTGIPTCAR